MRTLVPIIVALIAPIGAYLLAARKMSGRIGTSDADRLWQEAGDIRTEYRQQIAFLQGRVDTLLREAEACKAKLAELEARIRQLQADQRLSDRHP